MDHVPSRQRRDDDVRRKITRRFSSRDFNLAAKNIIARAPSFGKRARVIIRLKLAAKISVRRRPYFRRMHPTDGWRVASERMTLCCFLTVSPDTTSPKVL